MYTGDPLSAMTTGLLLSLIVTLKLVGTPPVVGGVQVTVSWSVGLVNGGAHAVILAGPGGTEREGWVG